LRYKLEQRSGAKARALRRLAGIHFFFRDPLVVLAIASPFGEKRRKKMTGLAGAQVGLSGYYPECRLAHLFVQI
jgi:hypothetical protein